MPSCALPLILSCAFGAEKLLSQTVQSSQEAQALQRSGPPATDKQSDGYITHGLNLGLYTAGAHDSSTGWYTVTMPFATYTFSSHYSTDVSVSVYPYRYAKVQTTGLTTIPQRVFAGGDVGDTLLEARAVFNPKAYRSISSANLTLPSGNIRDGLGTGRVTFSLDQQFERYYGPTGVYVDVGGGDSTGLQNLLVLKDATAIGPLGSFQAGVVTWLPGGMSMQTGAYEQLPIGDQKTYMTIMPLGLPAKTVVSGRKVIEDNGFTTTLYIPLTSHVVFSGSYNRSLRLHLDTVSTGFTFVWKGTPIRRRESLIDRAMREAESDVTTAR